MTPLILVAALAAALAVPQPRHAVRSAGHFVKRIWTAPPPAYCNEQRDCCLKKQDCAILGFLPAEKR